MPTIPETCAWATFLRNHDEVDLSGLSDKERAECFAAFGPKETMQLYGRGIRRRLAPMLGGDRRRIELAYAIQCALPGTPVLRYGEEIGMGDDLSLPERNALRTPMQWSEQANAGFSRAAADAAGPPGRRGRGLRLREGQRRRPTGGRRLVAGLVRADVADPARMPRVRHRELDPARPRDRRRCWPCVSMPPSGTVVALSNLRDEPVQVDLQPELPPGTRLLEVFANRRYRQNVDDLSKLDLDGWGYRWLQVRT